MKLTAKTFIAFAALSMSLLACSKDDNKNSNELNDADKSFIMQVSLGNSAEVGAGALASAQGEDPMIKSFGEMMVADHTTAQEELKTLGTSVDVDVKDSVDADHTTLLQTLQGLSGREFDSTYLVNQIADHEKTVAAFQAEVSSGSKSEVKDFANKYLPTIQMHLQTADSIATVMNLKD
jgi:putative membrane protein